MIRNALFHRSLALALLLTTPSCSRQSPAPTQPDVHASRVRGGPGAGGFPEGRSREAGPPNRGPGFYPLAVGNEWTYVSVISGQAWTPGGSRYLTSDAIQELRRSIECVTTIDGKEWFVERTRLRGAGSTVEQVSTNLLREDRNGLYQTAAPWRVDPCAQPITLTDTGSMGLLLRYPLHVGSTWTIWSVTGPNGPEPGMWATVEAHEVITVPAGRFPAYRIRVQNATGFEQRVWYGRPGFLASERTLDEPAICPGGSSGCRALTKWSVRLSSVSGTGAVGSGS